MSRYHCTCGFAIDDPEALADHLGWVFDRDDDIGTDGTRHVLVDPATPRNWYAMRPSDD
jgi:hypothetical protein